MTAAGGVTNRLTVTRTVTWRRLCATRVSSYPRWVISAYCDFPFSEFFPRCVIVASCRRFRTMRDTCAHPCRISVVCLSPLTTAISLLCTSILKPRRKETVSILYSCISLFFYFSFFCEKPFFITLVFIFSIFFFYFSLFFISLTPPIRYNSAFFIVLSL